MTALENAVFSLNDAEVFIEYLMNLGERHKAWPVRLEHFDVCILLCRSRLLRCTYCCIALYCDVHYSRRKCSANKGYIFNYYFYIFSYASSNSYASFVLSKIPACFISRWTHADVWTNCFITFSTRWKIFFSRDLFADVLSVHNRNMKHARAIEFDKTNLLAML